MALTRTHLLASLPALSDLCNQPSCQFRDILTQPCSSDDGQPAGVFTLSNGTDGEATTDVHGMQYTNDSLLHRVLDLADCHCSTESNGRAGKIARGLPREASIQSTTTATCRHAGKLRQRTRSHLGRQGFCRVNTVREFLRFDWECRLESYWHASRRGDPPSAEHTDPYDTACASSTPA